MTKRRALLALLVLIGTAAWGLPTQFAASRDGWFSIGFTYSVNPFGRGGSLGVVFEGADVNRFGGGATIIVGKRVLLSFDLIYFVDWNEDPESELVVPIKVRLGLIDGNPGLGLSAGLKMFALDVGEGSSYLTADGALSLDYDGRSLRPYFELGGSVATIFAPSSAYVVHF